MRARDASDMLLLGGIWGGAFALRRVAAPAFGAVVLGGIALAVGLVDRMPFPR